MYFFYITLKYIKNFLLLLFSLSFFLVIVDIIANYNRLPDSSNLQILYVYYLFLYGLDTFYPLAIVFSFLLTIYNMIKFNELVSFYSLGFSVKKISFPFVSVAFFIFSVFMLLNTGKFAYVREYANSILGKRAYADSNLFIKYNKQIIFIKKIKPIIKQAEDMRVFFIEKKRIKKIIYAKNATFKNNEWFVKNADIMVFEGNKIKRLKKDVKILKNFKPKIISNLKNLNTISFYDAYIAAKIFKNININTLLSIVFFKICSGLSLIVLIMILMFKTPIHQRIANVSLFLIKSVFAAVLIWGSELMIFKFSKQGVLNPYILFLPLIILFIYLIIILKKET